MKGHIKKENNMSLFSKIFGKIEPQNPLGDMGQANRIDDIKAKRSEGAITQEQFDDLMKDEGATTWFVRQKRLAAFVLFAGIGAALLFG